MFQINDKVTIILRSVGERTERLCLELILAQGVSQDNLFLIRETPFSAALRKSFEIGIERGLPWTMCIDADVLLKSDSIEILIRLADEQASNVCEIQGFVLDKFYGGPRTAGNHVYRTSLLPKIIEKIPPKGEDIRPETLLLDTMAAAGYPWVIAPYLVGLHAFEQYYRDIFRTCFVHAHKHQNLTAFFLSVWRAGAPFDRDYQVALKGYAAGIEHYQAVYIDAGSDVFAETLPFGEKDNHIPNELYSLDKIDKIIADWVEPEAYQQLFPTKMGLDEPHKSFLKKIKDNLDEFGLLKLIPYGLGRAFTKMGGWLQSQARK